MTSAVDIVNRSLLQIGARAQVSSISPSDGSTAADAAAVLFSPTFQMLARAAHWNCLRKQGSLTLLKAALGTPENVNGTTLPIPPTPWLYSYALPSDCLKMRAIVPSLQATGIGTPLTTFNNAAPTSLQFAGAVPFAVAYDTDPNGNPITVVLCNQDQAQAIWTVDAENPLIWDSQFQQAMVSSLAAFLVPALSLNLPLMQIAMQSAERIIAAARAADGNEGTQSMNREADWIVARGAGNWLGGCNTGYAAYESMAWPGF